MKCYHANSSGRIRSYLCQELELQRTLRAAPSDGHAADPAIHRQVWQIILGPFLLRPLLRLLLFSSGLLWGSGLWCSCLGRLNSQRGVRHHCSVGRNGCGCAGAHHPTTAVTSML